MKNLHSKTNILTYKEMIKHGKKLQNYKLIHE